MKRIGLVVLMSICGVLHASQHPAKRHQPAQKKKVMRTKAQQKEDKAIKEFVAAKYGAKKK